MPDRPTVNRREFLASSSAGLLALSHTSAVARTGVSAPSDPLDVSDRKQLFIDRRFIATAEGVSLTMNPAQKLGVVLDSANAPWELGTGGFFRVVEDGGKCKLYYGAFTKVGHSLAYAESDDGLRWTRPDLGIVTIEGSKHNNLIYADDAIDATIMIDPHDAPGRRYKAFRSRITSDKATAGVYASFSSDGVHFTEAGRVFPMWPETGFAAYWDARIGKYVVYTRAFAQGVENQRRIARIETGDLLKPWPFHEPATPILVPSPNNIDVVFSVDGQDDPFCDVYTNATFIYPFAQDVYLMFPTPFRHFAPQRQPWFHFDPGNDYGLIEVQMAVSRDGIRWSRPDRRPYFPMGMENEWDRWMTMMGTGMVRRGNYLYQYYWSTGRTHDSGILRPEYASNMATRSAIGAVRQRLDGFVSADFAYTGGTLTTPLMTFTGTHLRVNVDAGAMGSAFVEILDAAGKPVPGFTRRECEEVCANFIDTPVRWKGSADLTALQGKPVSLRIDARGTKLYSFQFAAGAVPV